MFHYRRFLIVAAAVLGAAVQCPAQLASLQFAYQSAPGAALTPVQVGGSIQFPQASVGANSSVILQITNNGQNLSIANATTSSSAFVVSPATASLASGSVTTLTITFSPTFVGATSVTLTLTLSDQESATFQLNGAGVASNFVISYSISPNGNQTVLTNQSTIQFPSTAFGQSSTAVVVIANQGASSGTVSNVSLAPSTSPAFQITGRPVVPATVNPNGTFVFNVVFTPTTTSPQTGTLQVTLLGISYSFVLQAQGSGAQYTYQTVIGSTTQSLQPNGTITFPDTNLGSTATVSVIVTNTGNAPGQIANATVTGTGNSFQRTDTVPLPITLPPAGTVTFTITFAPADVGALTGTFIVGSTIFNLQGNGLGAKLTFQFQVGNSTVSVANNGTVNFPNTNVGSHITGSLVITNAGNLGGTINSLNITNTVGSAFSATFPPTPVSIAVGKGITIPITFTPTTQGSQTGTLIIDSNSIALQGVGGAPQLISGYSFSGLGSTATPMTQPSVSLTLSQPYPTDVTGVLTLSFTSSSFVGNDPEIVFATGGTTVSFSIPANTTQALFGTKTSIQFQTGTVAGTIVLTPTFSLGSVNITPQNAPTLSTTVPAQAPTLTSAHLGTLAATSVQIIVDGFSTTRDVDTLNITITPASGSNVEGTSLSTDVTSTFSSWYQTAASQTVGSQFSATITLSVSGGTTDSISSVSVTAANSDGTSQAVSVPVN
jgi:hypothetical protein